VQQHNFLVVEDESADALLLRRALERKADNVAVEIVDDGNKALSHLRSAKTGQAGSVPMPSCIILDLKLRTVDGFSVLTEVKQDDQTRRIPVVVLTSSSDQNDVRHAYDLGANSYIVKPVEFSDLSHIAEKIVSYWGGTNFMYRSSHAS